MKKMKVGICALCLALFAGQYGSTAQAMIGKQNVKITNGKLTPEALWAMGRISSYAPSPDGKQIVYQVGYYSVPENKSRQVLYLLPIGGGTPKLLTANENSETEPAWIEGGKKVAFLSQGLSLIHI